MNDAAWTRLTRGAVDLLSPEELRARLALGRPLRVKLGVDPTSPDLHVGHTVVLQKLRTFQDLGHEVVFIIGDFTALIGDPSGRDVTRPQLSSEQIHQNAGTYQQQAFKILDRRRTEVVWNSLWLSDLFHPDRLSHPAGAFGAFFTRYTVQQLMERDDFTRRREAGHPITLSELFYPLFQGYDSVAVKADVEVGGTDQLFNLLMGRTMQRDAGQAPQVVMTLPLLEGTDGGRKMSKSYGNQIGISEHPGEMYGKVMSIPDTLLRRYYELLTEVPLSEVEKLPPLEAKKRLGRILVERFHGGGAAVEAEETFARVFSQRQVPDQVEEQAIPRGRRKMVDLLVTAGLAASKKAAQRLVDQGAVEVEGTRWTEAEIDLHSPVLLRVGKRRFKRIVPKK